MQTMGIDINVCLQVDYNVTTDRTALTGVYLVYTSSFINTKTVLAFVIMCNNRF